MEGLVFVGGDIWDVVRERDQSILEAQTQASTTICTAIQKVS